MSKEYSFSVMPSVSISRSKFNRKSQHKTTMNHGYLYPIYCDEVLPGDTRSLDVASLIRMSTPIAPIMDNIYMDLFAFFVPNRIVWDHWKEFMGENNSSAGLPIVSYTVPKLNHMNPNLVQALPTNLCAYLYGIPVAEQTGVSYLQTFISALPARGYYKIYNRWFRNQNLTAPIPVRTDDNFGVVIGNSNDFTLELLQGAKLADYFTKALPYAQKGNAVSIPLGNSAPVIVANSTLSTGSAYDVSLLTGMNGKVGLGSSQSVAMQNQLTVDLAQATGATINQLRYAFQLQKLLEKDALYGSRYWEILSAHFGIQASDQSLQDPEYLGGTRININIDQVLSTAGYNNTSATTVGAPGANSVTARKGSLFTKSFTEHGYIFVIAIARHDQTYGQGLARQFTRSGRYDYYWPVFANLGAQDVKLKEIYFDAAANQATNDTVFGYQEAWAEYRYKPSMATGLLNPVEANSLNFWDLANNFGSAPTLSNSFILENRDNLARALVTGTTGPDYICDFYFVDTAVRPMPVYSIPGLIDHH